MLSVEPKSPLLMGIVNITPDSFSDGGRYMEPDSALKYARSLWEAGAHILDIGAESTRPGYVPLSEEEEWRRLSSILPHLRKEGYCLSLDTMKAAIARKGLEAGVSIINDIWGLQKDPEMAFIVADFQARLIVMHNRQDAQENLILWDDFERFFDRSLEIAHHAGIAKEQLILDPGVGFGKIQAQNIEAICLIKRLKAHYKLPILLGASRKSLFGHYLERALEERLPATLATHLYGVEMGADILRVHDVRAHHDVLMMRQILQNMSSHMGI